MKKLAQITVFLTILILMFAGIAGADIPAAERQALIDLYNSTGGTNWTDSTNWLDDAGTECTWYGITCDGDGNHVTEINLDSNNLSGTIPESVGNFTNLQKFALSSNQLTGSIPEELGGLSDLTHLYLSTNQLSGTIPSSLGSLSKLASLKLNRNQLTGSIPSELGNLASLAELYLYENQLTGSIPEQLGNLTNLQQLWLHQNQLSGSIPAQLGSLANLQILYLNNNQLTGSIPPELENLTSLQHLYLLSNQLSGSIPAELGSLSNLISLRLNSNQLSGSIPSELGNLTNLEQLFLSQNQLSGSIPPQLGNLINLTYLGVFENELTGSIPAELGNLTNLRDLGLQSNQLTGTIPPQLGNLSNLELLYLHSNQLTGTIPPQLGSLSNLTRLTLNSNQLNGEIPSELGSLSNLEYLYLHGNQLSGTIPSEFKNLTNLGADQLDLEYNALYTDDDNLRTFLNSKQDGGDWESTQTTAPADLAAGTPAETSVPLTWTAIAYTGDTGGYEVYYSETSGGPYTLFETTADKTVETSTVTGLSPDMTYYFKVRTKTEPTANNTSTVYSEYTDEISATTEAGTTTGIPAAERQALIDLYNSTGGANWTDSTGWLGDAGTECAWYGVTCNAEETHVTDITLSGNNLVGTIPASLGDFTSLYRLRLQDNQLSGDIPPELGSLTNLETLNLRVNQLTGNIPSELGSLTSLQTLYLADNQLSGSVPPELGSLSNLEYLYLYSNQLSGSIPSELGNLSNLKSLYLSNNLTISGAIPPQLGNLINLEKLCLDRNQLSGTIPSELGSLANLQILDLYTNQLTGNIPAELGNLSKLTQLQLQSNQLEGSIPAEIGNLSALTTLNLYNNQLTGTIPAALGNLSNLIFLNLNTNQLSGSIPAELGSLSKLAQLQLQNNQLDGSIPAEIGNLASLTHLNLYSNQLSGSIPPELANLSALTNLSLNYNALYSEDATLSAFLDGKSSNWESTQTVAPANLSAGTQTADSVPLTWTAIAYTGDTGGYEIEYSETSGGPYTLFETTADKTVESSTVTGLSPDTTYYFRVRTKTAPHINNQNTVYSEYTDEIWAKTTKGWIPISGITTSTNFNAIWTADGADVFVLGDNGRIIRQDIVYNNTVVSTYGSGSFHDIWGISESDVFAVAENSSNNGTSTMSFNNNTITASNGAYTVCTSSGNCSDKISCCNGVTNFNGINITCNDGSCNYSYITSNTSASGSISCGSSKNIFHYNGSSWTQMTGCAPGQLNGIWGSSENDVFAVGDSGEIVLYDGTSLLSMTSGISDNLNDVGGISENDVFAVGDSGIILRYNGISWSSMTSGTSNNLFGVWAASESDVFAVGESGIILHYDGTGWSEMTSGTSFNLNAIWGSSADDVFAVGDNGTILRYNGTSWAAMPNDDTDNLMSIYGADGNVFAVGNAGTLLQYSFSTDAPILSVTPMLQDVSPLGGTVSFGIANTGTGTMNWTAVSNDTWLTVDSGVSGTDSGTITVSCEALSAGTRTGTVTITAPGAADSPQTIEVRQSDGLIAYYPFNGNANDESGNGNHGTEYGDLLYSSGVAGQAASFDSTDDYVQVPDNEKVNFGPNQDFSMAVWFKAEPDQSDWQGTLLSKHNIGDPKRALGYSLRLRGVLDTEDNGKLSLLVGDGVGGSGGDSGFTLYSADTYDDSTWHQAVATIDRDGLARLYVDGQEISSADISHLASVDESNSANLEIGRENNAGIYLFNGLIDDARIYNYVLSEAEIQELYNQRPDISRGLVAHYEFEGNANDSSGNGNDGTEYGGLTYGSGVSGRAASFDGVDDYIINTAPSGIYDLGSVFSISFWMNPENQQLGGIINVAEETKESWSVTYHTSGVVGYHHNWERAEAYENSYLTEEQPLKTWSHIVLVYNEKHIDAYLNGVYLSESDFINNPVYDGDEWLEIGANRPGGDEHFLGKLDELRIYNRPLSEAEIQELYNADAPDTSRGLIAHYEFEGNANDTSGNENHGTEYNGITYESGVIGQAVSFDGVDSYVDLPDGILTPSYTVSLWTKANEGNETNKELRIFDGWTVGEICSIAYAENYSTDNPIHVGYTDPGNYIIGSFHPWYSETKIYGERHLFHKIDSEDRWHLMTISYDAPYASFYIDGVKVNEYTFNEATGYYSIGINMSDYLPDIDFSLGTSKRNSTYFKGVVDDVRIYNRAISEAEIQELYNLRSDTDGLVAYYPFNGNANDDSGNGYHGEVKNGVALTADRFGNPDSAYHFDGADDWIDVPGVNFDFTETEFTFSVWFKADELKSLQNIFWVRDNQPAIHLRERTVDFGYRPGITSLPATAEESIDDNLALINEADWNFAAYTYTSGDNTLRFYLNGSQVGWRRLESGFIKTADGKFRIGVDDGTGEGRWFSGSIDELRVYDYALPETEIQTLYDDRPKLVGHWKFDETSGGTAVDSSGNGNDGTINGAVLTTGKSGSALDFTGDGNYVELPGIFSDYVSGPFTVMMWVNVTNPRPVNYIFHAIDDRPGIRLNSANQVGFAFKPDPTRAPLPNEDADIISSEALPSEEWVHIAYTWDGTTTTSGTYKGYISGNPTISKELPFFELGGTVHIGMDGNPLRSFDGLIDDVRIYNYALSEAEILEIGGTSHIYVDASFTGAGDGSKEAPYTTISDAIPHVQSGDTLRIMQGTYEESLVISISGLTLEGGWVKNDGGTLSRDTSETSFSTHIIPPDDTDEPAIRLNNAPGTLIEGFMLHNGMEILNSDGAELNRNIVTLSVLAENSQNLVISNNEIVGVLDDTTSGRGIVLDNSSGEIRGNTLHSDAIGISCTGTGATIAENVVHIRNTDHSGLGIEVKSGNAVIQKNVLYFQGTDMIAIHKTDSSASADIQENHFYGEAQLIHYLDENGTPQDCTALPTSNFCHQTKPYIPCTETEGRPCIDITFIPLPLPDEDSDGLTDEWEVYHLGGTAQDSTSDSDGDGLSNLKEFENGTNPDATDSDEDGLTDEWEIRYGLNPLVENTADGVFICVDPDFSGKGDGTLDAPFSTLTAAVNNAAPGVTIRALPGQYNEALAITNRSNLKIEGGWEKNADGTWYRNIVKEAFSAQIIPPDNPDGETPPAISLSNAPDIVIDGFMLHNGVTAQNADRLELRRNLVTISIQIEDSEDIILTENELVGILDDTETGVGIVLTQSDGDIRHNTIHADTLGISYSGISSGTIAENIVHVRNTQYQGHGIRVFSGNVLIERNVLFFQGSDMVAIRKDASGASTDIQRNHFYGESGLIHFLDNGTPRYCAGIPPSNFCHQTEPYVSCVSTEGIPCIDITFIPLPLPDEDEDGLTDRWEKHHLGDMSQDQNTDADGDGLSNGQEFEYGTNPKDQDSEGDGLGDYDEIFTLKMNPLVGSATPYWWEDMRGVFTVGETGYVWVDALYDGGAYQSELGIFKLNGMETMVPGSKEFIQEAARRAKSNTKEGHIVFSDITDSVRFEGNLGESGQWNAGIYRGLRKFEMEPGDQFALILIPDGTLEYVCANPDTKDTKKRPLFSIASTNQDYGMHLGQIADVNGQGTALVFEDLDFESSDKDYNDLVFHLGELTGIVPRLTSLSNSDFPTLESLLAPGKTYWPKDTILGQRIATHLEMPYVGENDEWISVNLTSPAELTVYDPDGNTCGPSAGCDILGAVLDINEDGDQLVYLPELKTGAYRFEMSSATDGDSQLTVGKYQGEILRQSEPADFAIGADQVMVSDAWVSEDRTLTVEIPKPADAEIITASAGAGGSIGPSDKVIVTRGEDQTFSIQAAEGFYVKDVLVDGDSVGAVSSYTIKNVETAHTIKAFFEIEPEETVTVTIHKHGTGSGTLSESTQEVAYGSNLAVTATPDASSVFAGWSGDASGTGDAVLENITSDKEIIATFDLAEPFTITPKIIGKGSISPAEPLTVAYGDDASFTIEPSTGWHTAALRVDDNPVEYLEEYTFRNVTENHTIEAEFVNDTPVISDIVSQYMNEDSAAFVSFTAEDTETPNDSLVVSAISSEPEIIPEEIPCDQGEGNAWMLNIEPAENVFGTVAITVTVADEGGSKASRTFDLEIRPVNDPPFFVKGPDQKVRKNSKPHEIAEWASRIVAGPANESDQSLEFQVSTDNDGLFSEGPAISPDGTLTYTVAKKMSGTATVTVILKDSGGVENGGTDTSEPQTFTITISELPMITGTPDDAVKADTDYSFIPDVENGGDYAFTFYIENKPSWAEFDPETGTLTGTPSPDDAGTTEGIIIRIEDANGEEIDALPPFNLAVVVPGDIDGDGEVGLNDAVPAMKILAGIYDGEQIIYSKADINGDGKIGIEEVIYILQQLSNH